MVQRIKMLNKITVIGVGLIGGSFAKAARTLDLADEVVGYGPHQETLDKAIKLGVIDKGFTQLEAAVKDADLVLLSVPLGAMTEVLRQIKPFMAEDTILTDVGSAKTSVIKSVKDAFGFLPSMFVAGHPIAGKEQSGVESSCEHLFTNHKVILTPTHETDLDAIAQVREIWEMMGACVSEMTPDYHDEVLAATSHLPHLLAFGLVDLLNEHEELGNVFQYTAGGFRDFTRIASSDATMWRDIALSNQTAIVKWLKNYQAEVKHLTDLIEHSEGEKLFELFRHAKFARDTHIVKKDA